MHLACGKAGAATRGKVVRRQALQFSSVPIPNTMPNYRLPPTPAIHEATCPSATCKQKAKEMLSQVNIKTVAKLAQRVQREATGYYCGYTFKGQVTGR